MAKDPILLQRAREMRRNPTPFERKLWLALRAKRFRGAKFRQQQVVDRYIVDFACRDPRMLIIELDGDSHASQLDYDRRRTAILEDRGYRVLRFTNADVGHNLDGVLTIVAAALESPSLPPLAAAPSLP